MEEDLKKPKSYNRKKLVAFLLSALIPGLGQLYNGQLKKSVIYSIGLLILPIGFNLMGLKQYFWIYATLIILIIENSVCSMTHIRLLLAKHLPLVIFVSSGSFWPIRRLAGQPANCSIFPTPTVP